MNDRAANFSQEETLDTLLNSELGTVTLSVAQRQRLQTLTIKSRHRADVRTGNRTLLLRAVAGAVIVAIVLTGALSTSLMFWDSGTDVSAAERLLSPPQPGNGRHVVIEAHNRYSRDGGDRRWVGEYWERTLADGTRQAAVEARTLSGEPLGTYIQSSNGWYVEFLGSSQSGDAQPGWLPVELNPTYQSLESVRTVLAGYNADQIDVREDEGIQFIEVPLAGDGIAQLAQQVEGDMGEPVQRILWRVELDPDANRLISARLVAVGESGVEFEINSFAITSWDELAAAELGDGRFVPPAQVSDPRLRFRHPDPRGLPTGLVLVNHYLEAADYPWFAERVVFSGDAGLVVDLTITPVLPGGESSVRYGEGTVVHHTPSLVGVIEWTEKQDGPTPRGARWQDEQFYYALSVTRPYQSQVDWSVAELVEFVEAVTEAQQAQ